MSLHALAFPLRQTQRMLAAGLCAGIAIVGGFLASAQERPGAAAPLLSTDKTIVGGPIAYPAGTAKVTANVIVLAPGQETGWHIHDVPLFGYLLEGELTVDYGTLGKRVYHAGDAFMEAIRLPHNGRNTGAGPMRILAVFMGAEGIADTTLAEPAPAGRPR